ncbi:MAG: substrate-binding domain-containing protein, partial [Limisphaerales bacterium]
RIPEDISVVGFGNVLTSSFFRVPLTTVRQPKQSMGIAAMDMLDAIIRGEKPEPVRMPTSLLVRKSTAAPPEKPFKQQP